MTLAFAVRCIPLLALSACAGPGAFGGGATDARVSATPGTGTIYVLAPGAAAGSRASSRADPEAVRAVAAAAADQVRRCYRFPQIRTEGRRIVTRLLVRLAEDGSLVQLPRVISQQGLTPLTRAHAAAMAQAASLAVIRCAPLRLPPELHKGGWDELQLTFSPQVRA